MTGSKNENGLTWIWIVAFAAFAVLHRLVPYLFDLGPGAHFVWNFAPVGAVGLFAGARCRSPFAVLTPVAVMLVSHLLMWRLLAARGEPTFGWMTPILYGRLPGLRADRPPDPPRPIAVGNRWGRVPGALQFYLITNFACWAGGEGANYAKTLAGLIQCYVEALPFFGNTLAGDLAYSGLFFGLHALSIHVLERRKASESA